MTVTLTYDPATRRTLVAQDGLLVADCPEPYGTDGVHTTIALYEAMGATVTAVGLPPQTTPELDR